MSSGSQGRILPPLVMLKLRESRSMWVAKELNSFVQGRHHDNDRRITFPRLGRTSMERPLALGGRCRRCGRTALRLVANREACSFRCVVAGVLCGARPRSARTSYCPSDCADAGFSDRRAFPTHDGGQPGDHREEFQRSMVAGVLRLHVLSRIACGGCFSPWIRDAIPQRCLANT